MNRRGPSKSAIFYEELHDHICELLLKNGIYVIYSIAPAGNRKTVVALPYGIEADKSWPITVSGAAFEKSNLSADQIADIGVWSKKFIEKAHDVARAHSIVST